MALVRSYVAGHWFAPDSGTPVFDAVTGEPVAEVSSQGIDFGAALAYGRQVGGPALRELTFHERAELAKEIGQLLRKHRDELMRLSYRTGATLYDSKFDIDGGIGVLLSYASKAKRELPNDTVIVEGAARAARQGGRLPRPAPAHPSPRRRGAGQRLQLPRVGAAGEARARAHRRRAEPHQAASQTGYLTALMVELIIDAQILPDGALQLVSGGAGDLLDHLDEQDLLSFTGSASTANRLRSHPNVVARSVRFNAEADSLNMSVLGPDATPGTKSVRPVRQAAGRRDDRQGRPEVHRDPPRLRP